MVEPPDSPDQQAGPPTGRAVLVIGDDEDLGQSVAEHVQRWGNHADRLHRPDDDELRRHLPSSVDGVAVVSRNDIVALRYALLIEHLVPGVRLVVTIFDRTVANELTSTVPNCTVLGMTDAIVPALLGSCVSPNLSSLQRSGDQLLAVEHTDYETRVRRRPLCPDPWKSRFDMLLSQFRPVENSSRAMVTGFVGLLLVLALDSILARTVLHEHWSDAIWHGTRTLATVGSSPAAEHAPTWHKLLSVTSMLAVLALTAMFTAGFVDRLMSRRLTGIVGMQAVPRHNHVVVVGLGQVAVRLCRELQAMGINVVAVERDRHAPCLPLARELGIPVVLGRGGDRFLLQRLSVSKARALVAVSSDSLENITVSVTARAIAPHLRIVLRAGGDEVTSESQSLFRIGAVCDVTRIAGPFVAARLLGLKPRSVFNLHGHTLALLDNDVVVDLTQWMVQSAGNVPACNGSTRTEVVMMPQTYPVDASKGPMSMDDSDSLASGVDWRQGNPKGNPDCAETFDQDEPHLIRGYN